MDAIVESEKEIVDGNLWKAKEILHKSVKYSGYDVGLYEQLGKVLLQMKDTAEAGKYLFLSGVRLPEYEDAIRTFLDCYKGKPHNVFHPFPRAAKLENISEYPPNVVEELRNLGLPDQLSDVHQLGRPRDGSSNKVAAVIFFAILFSVLGLVILWIIKLLEMIF